MPRSPRASSSRGEAFVPCPLLSSKKKKGKRRKKRNRDSTLNRSMEVHDPARLQPLIHSRPHSLCFLLSATRFERPDDDFTRYPLLYFCFDLSLSLSLHVSCHSMTGRNYCRRYLEACRAIFFSRLHSCNYEQFQLLFPRPR